MNLGGRKRSTGMTLDGYYVSSRMGKRISVRDYLLNHDDQNHGSYTLRQVFEDAAARATQTVAATDGKRSWTWKDWQHDSNAVGRGLQECGVEPGCVVAARLANSWEFVTLHTAVAGIGAV